MYSAYIIHLSVFLNDTATRHIAKFHLSSLTTFVVCVCFAVTGIWPFRALSQSKLVALILPVTNLLATSPCPVIAITHPRRALELKFQKAKAYLPHQFLLGLSIWKVKGPVLWKDRPQMPLHRAKSRPWNNSPPSWAPLLL